MLGCLSGLTALHLEGLHTHFEPGGLARLGALTALRVPPFLLCCRLREMHGVRGCRDLGPGALSDHSRCCLARVLGIRALGSKPGGP